MNKNNQLISDVNKRHKRKFCRFVVLLILIQFVFVMNTSAQVKYSIYSMFGIGQLSDNSFGINRTMGGTGIAFQSGRSINYLNPASYLGIPTSSYLMEGGVYGIYSTANNNYTYQSGGNINFSYFSATFYFAEWWSTSFGIVPFSSVDYQVNTTEEIEGSLDSYNKNYQGSGGLSKIYFGNSFNIFDGLSVGLNTSYLVGPIKLIESVEASSDYLEYKIENNRIAYSLYLDYGLQYSIDVNDLQYTFGFIYGAGKKVNTKDDLKFTYSDSTISLDQENKLEMELPQKIGFGLALKKGSKFRIGIDYEWAKWSGINFSNPDLSTKNSNRFSIGAEYFPAERGDEEWYKHIYYRCGANYKNTYLKIDKVPINSFAIDFGVGIPYDLTSTINLSLEYGEEGTLLKGLIKNKYWLMYLSFTLPEFWTSHVAQ